MCNKIFINKGEIEIETPQEFLDHFGFLPIKEEYYNEIIMDSCLCQCDLEETFSQHKIAFKIDCMDFYIHEKKK